ncbi:hypothetical protein [Chryseobacterium mucoviscidosis]|uniref:Uncharacterized protein n=1 Tax=Chryseobacterium mucoviscidosis TaxID=1945581 RepID=A0A202C302_9FLAO|nr:hypothetical protein [Chryseobacterium mucoviscidosis]OVE58110.1 hypothetical protein B0E34_07980 [Chryseobacterium mucoviscidosis]
MNHRVLELLKTPKNIQSEDLHLLKEEINSFPYIQNIRALYLYGVHLYDKDNYQKVLSTTAAYTTDKKILYQLINGKIQQKPKPEIKLETVKEKNIPSENPLKILYQKKAGSFPLKREENPASEPQPETVEESLPDVAETKETDRILPPPREEIKHLYVNGERNRILFEGEENFLEDNTFETIDLESTLESGSIVTQKAEKKEEPVSEEKPAENIPAVKENEEFIPETTVEEENVNSEAQQEEISDNSESESSKEETVSEIQIQEEENKSTEEQSDHISDEAENEDLKPAEEISEFTPETIVEEENINAETEKEEVEDLSELSFHETEAFLPEVQVSANESVEEPKNESSQSENSEINASEESAEFTPETIIDEDEISSEKEEKVVQNDAELSFHGTESFLPEVKIQANTEEKITEAPQLNLNKHEDEMRRLIEEVEKKMKEKAAAEEHKKEEEPENIGHDISFAETQSFEVKPVETESKEATAKENPVAENNAEQIEEPKAEITEEKEEIPLKEETEAKSAWKPMSFDSNLPDSLISKSPEVVQPETEGLKADKTEGIQQPEIGEQKQIAETETEPNSEEESVVSEISEDTVEKNTDENVSETSEENKEEVPVMNVSFFGSGWTIPQPEKEKMTEEPKQESKEEKTVEIPVEKPAKTAKPNVFDSNVPGFINTWQSWLKIDRTEEKPKEEKPDLKTKVIETFIENNPRISQLKEESTFVVKEKGDDISHLMTETLANLYFEQKLYTKAIKAFEILIKKTPEKKKYYEGKIQEIKDFRTKG